MRLYLNNAVSKLFVFEFLDSQLVLIKKVFDILILHTKALYTSICAEESIPITFEVYKIF